MSFAERAEKITNAILDSHQVPLVSHDETHMWELDETGREYVYDALYKVVLRALME